MKKQKDLYAFKKDILPSGITVYTNYLSYATKVNIGALFGVGAFEGKPGTSHMLEHLFSLGGKELIVEDMVKDEGGNISLGSTGLTATHFKGKVPVGEEKVLLNALEILLDPPTCTDKEEATEKKSVINEALNKVDYPDLMARILTVRLEKEVKWKSFLKKALDTLFVIGNIPEIKALRREDLMNHYKKYFCTNNLFFFVTGNFQRKRVLELIEERRFANKANPSLREREYQFPAGADCVPFVKKNAIFPFSEFGNGGTPQSRSIIELEAFVSKRFASEMVIFQSIFRQLLFDLIRKEHGETYSPSVKFFHYNGGLEFFAHINTGGHFSVVTDAIAEAFMQIKSPKIEELFNKIFRQKCKANSCLNEDSGTILVSTMQEFYQTGTITTVAQSNARQEEATFEKFQTLAMIIEDSMQTMIVDKDS